MKRRGRGRHTETRKTSTVGDAMTEVKRRRVHARLMASLLLMVEVVAAAIADRVGGLRRRRGRPSTLKIRGGGTHQEQGEC
jgi:hypothetical protein